jgi:serine/threonine protein phosphatase PrpC
VANVGDSRAVLFRKDKALRMTVDHKPRAEEERIKSIEGGCVTGDGGGRVNGQLAVSRSLGDFYMHPYVTYEPHTFFTDLTTVRHITCISSVQSYPRDILFISKYPILCCNITLIKNCDVG